MKSMQTHMKTTLIPSELRGLYDPTGMKPIKYD